MQCLPANSTVTATKPILGGRGSVVSVPPKPALVAKGLRDPLGSLQYGVSGEEWTSHFLHNWDNTLLPLPRRAQATLLSPGVPF